MTATDFSNDLRRELGAIDEAIRKGRDLEALWLVLGLKMFLDHVPEPRQYQLFINSVSRHYLHTRNAFDEAGLAGDCDHLERMFNQDAGLMSEEYRLILSLMVDLAQADIYLELAPGAGAAIARVRRAFGEFLKTSRHHRQIRNAEIHLKGNHFTLRAVTSLIAYVEAPAG